MNDDDRASILNRDVRYNLFRVYIVISAVLSLLFSIIHLINRRPAVNLITAAAAFLLCLAWFALSSNYKHYGLARISFLAVFSLLWLPFGYMTSPGSYSAMPYLAIMASFILAVVARNTWEYIFPVLMIFQMPLLFRMEVWFPEKFVRYTDVVYRINDLTLNFTVAISAIVATVIFMMHSYNRVNLQLYELSVLDDLTGLFNRRYLIKFLEMEHNRSGRTGRAFSLAFIDLDNFKRINDTMGHLAGDRVLKDISGILRDNIRSYDIASRYGGDEFIIIFPETDSGEAEKRMESLDVKFRSYSEQYSVQEFSVSWGVAGNDGRSVPEVLHLADEILYKNKKRKR